MFYWYMYHVLAKGIDWFVLLISNRFSNGKIRQGRNREKTYLLTCAPKEDSNQPVHPRSLNRALIPPSNAPCEDSKWLREYAGWSVSSLDALVPLRKHDYSNILKILPPKNENFQIKHSVIFHISAKNIEPPRRSGSNEYQQSLLLVSFPP